MRSRSLFFFTLFLVTTATIICGIDYQPAGYLAANLTATVTGQPARADTMQKALSYMMRRAVTLQPDTSLSFELPELERDLMPGHWQKTTVPYLIAGEGYQTVRSEVAIMLRNEELTAQPVSRLLVSNNPEEVNHPGVLFEQKIDAGQRNRFIFYHKGNYQRYQLSFVLRNEEEFPLRIWVLESAGGPSVDSIFSGHTATKRYWHKKNNAEGIIVELLPHESVEVFFYALKPEQITAGLLEVQSLNGQAVLSLIAVNEEFGGESRFVHHPRDAAIARGGRFDMVTQKLSLRVDADNPARMIRLGAEPWARDVETGDILKGNYGIIYDIALELDNSRSEQSAYYEIQLLAGGGMARGLFVIDGQLYETGLVTNEHYRARITGLAVERYARRQVRIRTMPEPGSYYPVSILVRKIEDDH